MAEDLQILLSSRRSRRSRRPVNDLVESQELSRIGHVETMLITGLTKNTGCWMLLDVFGKLM